MLREERKRKVLNMWWEGGRKWRKGVGYMDRGEEEAWEEREEDVGDV